MSHDTIKQLLSQYECQTNLLLGCLFSGLIILGPLLIYILNNILYQVNQLRMTNVSFVRKYTYFYTMISSK